MYDINLVLYAALTGFGAGGLFVLLVWRWADRRHVKLLD